MVRHFIYYSCVYMNAYNNSNPRFLELLIQHLCTDVDTGKPATVTGVTVVPAQGILKTPNLV